MFNVGILERLFEECSMSGIWEDRLRNIQCCHFRIVNTYFFENYLHSFRFKLFLFNLDYERITEHAKTMLPIQKVSSCLLYQNLLLLYALSLIMEKCATVLHLPCLSVSQFLYLPWESRLRMV